MKQKQGAFERGHQIKPMVDKMTPLLRPFLDYTTTLWEHDARSCVDVSVVIQGTCEKVKREPGLHMKGTRGQSELKLFELHCSYEEAEKIRLQDL